MMLTFILSALLLAHRVNCFSPVSLVSTQIGNLHRQVSKFQLPSSISDINEVSASSPTTVEVILFGIGDLRTVDHEGLSSALIASISSNDNASTPVFPLVILDTKDTLPKIPMVRSHTLDTASMISTSLQSLQDGLADLGLDLHVKTDEKNGVQNALTSVISELKTQNPTLEQINVHTCDLGAADNSIGYGPFSHLGEKLDDDETHDLDVQIKSWNCDLRSNPRKDINIAAQNFPDTFSAYQTKYSINTASNIAQIAKLPVDIVREAKKDEKTIAKISIPSITKVPTIDEITSLLCQSVNLDPNDETTCNRIKKESNTGMYASHWGGLDSSTMMEKSVLRAVDVFVNAPANGYVTGDDALVESLNWWTSEETLKRNPCSLEHAALYRLMFGGTSSANSNDSTIGISLKTIKTENLIEGEVITRYLAAPLLFGTTSSRYLWYKANRDNGAIINPSLRNLENMILPAVFRKKSSVDIINTMVEGREWHNHFAAKNIKLNPVKKHTEAGELSYKYWRWHGFLCRYGDSILSGDDSVEEKEAIVLVHGFGASGSQWGKAISELNKSIIENNGNSKTTGMLGFAPDLIGFGQSEKPSFTFTQYLWESYISTFTKEEVLGKSKCKSYVVGGNSIGGYTALGVAASDNVDTMSNRDSKTLCASGAPGAGMCKGLVLINSAGPVLTEDEVNEKKSEYVGSVAEITGLDLLGEVSPPPRRLAKIGGEGLLWYLRPQIQSICKNLYPTNPTAVNEELCDEILRDSKDPGAINVMISGSKLPPPRTVNELLDARFGSVKSREGAKFGVNEGTFDGSVLVAQGMLDPLNDARGRASNLEKLRDGITVDAINGGHCPHDELPDAVSKSIVNWMSALDEK